VTVCSSWGPPHTPRVPPRGDSSLFVADPLNRFVDHKERHKKPFAGNDRLPINSGAMLQLWYHNWDVTDEFPRRQHVDVVITHGG
jgi:hypothetical protein